MNALTAESIYERDIRKLSREEKQKLADTILRDLRDSESDTFAEAWERVQAHRPYHYRVEDAQAWISRTRREADESREASLNRPK
jgi:hypothetical protein